MTLNILYGPPGSGKTTAIQSLLKEMKFSYISIGEIYRKEIEKKSIFGEELRQYVETDTEYPQHIIRRIVEPYILEITDSHIIILDGFPKHEKELEVLETILKNHSVSLKKGKVITLNIDLGTALNRMLRRTVCPKCDFHADQNAVCPRCGYKEMIRRQDDNNQEFTSRFNTFMRNNKLIVSQLNAMGFETITVDATQNKTILLDIIKSQVFAEATSTPYQAFQQLTGLHSKVMSTIDHAYISPPVRLLHSHKLLYEVSKYKPVTILNWDVSQPNERTYRYDMQLDLMVIGRSKEHFLFSEGSPFATQVPHKLELDTYEKKFEMILDNLQATNKFSKEAVDQIHTNYTVLKEQVLDKIIKDDYLLPDYTKKSLININRLLKRNDIADFIDANYFYYFNSRLMTEWIPYCIETITGPRSIEKVFEAGIFGRRIFRYADGKTDDSEVNDLSYLLEYKKHITSLVRDCKLIPSIELLYWSLEYAGIQHFGNDYEFFERYGEYLGEQLSNQLTTVSDDGSNYFEMKEDYGVSIDPCSGKYLTKNSKSSVKHTRINSIYGIYILLGSKMLAINNTNFKYPQYIGVDKVV